MKKRMLALLAVLCCVALVAALFVACNNGEKGQSVDNNTGVTTPGDDDAQQGAETPDDEEQGGETPDDEQGGDTQDPADPDEGEENPDEDINEPETPDEDIEGPIVPEEKEPTTISELLSGDEVYQQEALNALTKACTDSLLFNALDRVNIDVATADKNKIQDLQIDISENNCDSITKFKLYFTYNESDKLNYYFIVNIEPTEEVTLSELLAVNDQNVADEDNTVLSTIIEKFALGRAGADFTFDETFRYDPSIQESSAALTEALKNVAIKDGDLEIEIDESAEFYIVDGGYTVDTILESEARRVTLFAKTDHGYQELVYRIAYENYDIGKLVEKINAGRYRMAVADKGEFTGHIISVKDNVDADAVGE